MCDIKFQVEVDINVIPPIFTFYNEKGQPTDGSVTTEVNEPITITYTLKSSGFTFTTPSITNNFDNDVTYNIQEGGQQLIITDSAQDKINMGLQLIVTENSTGQRYASPDPRIKNKPSQ
jgi:hypothetical protein